MQERRRRRIRLYFLANGHAPINCSHVGSSLAHRALKMTAAFHRWQLEGRALEHAFAGASGSGIRMKTSSGVWKVVHSQPIREEMNDIARRVRSGMASEGVRILGADCPCFLKDNRPTRSVDLRIKLAGICGAVELKFSRRSLDTACRNANSSWLLEAAKLPGSFLMGGRKYKMNLQVVGDHS